ncbi:hypothetical protein D3C72_1056240 [compost metagenome]
MGEDLLGIALLLHPPLMQEHDLVGDVTGKRHLVGDHQHGAPLLGQLAHQTEHLPHQFGIERRGGFIEQHHLGIHRQRPGNGRPLLLAAGEMTGVVVAPLPQTHPVEQQLSLGDGLGTGHLEHLDGHLDDVLHDGHVRPEVEALEHHGQTAADPLHLTHVLRQALTGPIAFHADQFAMEGNRAGRGGFQQIDTA